MAGLNKYVGWGITTFLLMLLNKGSNSHDETAQEPDKLNVTSAQTKIGSPIPVVIGRGLVKSPIVSWFGDFQARVYTETYAAHAHFSAWPLVFSLIAHVWMSKTTGHIVEARTLPEKTWTKEFPVKSGAGGSVTVTIPQDDITAAHYIKDNTPPIPTPTPTLGNPEGFKKIALKLQEIGDKEEKLTKVKPTYGTAKDDKITPLLWSLFLWLINWLINGRHLKTTIQKGFKYYLGYQFLVSWSGPKMHLKRIYMDEKEAWAGDVSQEGQNGAVYDIDINKDELFGGVDEQGGFVGHMHAYLGGDAQGTDEYMVKQMSGDSVQEDLRGLTPAYRPFVTIVVPKAYIGKQATIPETWVELENYPDHLGLGKVGGDANPAEAIYEIITNNDWGLAEPEDNINLDSLKAIGKTLADEGVGISIQLSTITKMQSLLDKICEHINAVHYSDPETGKLTFKLIRNDYDVAKAPRLDTHNCESVKFTRLDWKQTVSKISVEFMDASNRFEDATVPANDPAGIEINSDIQTVKSYDYSFFTTAANAKWSAERELLSQAYPLATVTIDGNRCLSNLRIGDVVVLNWEPYGVKNMVLRITNVDIGDFEEGKVEIDAMEDVFSLQRTDIDFSGSTEWTEPDIYPEGVQHFKFMEMPYEIINDIDTYVSAFAAAPDANTQSWTVWRHPYGGSFVSTNSLSKWTPAGRLVYDLAEFGDVEDTIGFEIVEDGDNLQYMASSTVDFTVSRKGGQLIVIDDEILAYSTLQQLPNGHWYIKGVLRGVCDTVPAQHYAQAEVYFIRSGNYANVTTGGPVCTSGTTTTEDYNITTATVQHTEEFNYAKIKSLTTKRRSECPSVPGRVRMSAQLVKDVYHAKQISGDLSISFVARNNRQSFGMVSQDDEKEFWTQMPFAADTLTDYILRVTSGDATKDYTFTSSPVSLPWATYCSDFQTLANPVRVELYARNDDLLSYQPQVRTFTWVIPMLCDIKATESEAAAELASWGTVDRITIPAGKMLPTDEQVLYTDSPLILLGNPAPSGTTVVNTGDASASSGAIYSLDGTLWIPNGKALRPTGKGTYDVIHLDNGFVFNSWYVENGNGGMIRSYAWDGSTIIWR